MAGRVGIVGIGIMGTAMMRNLLRHSFEVVGYDIRGRCVRLLAQAGLPVMPGAKRCRSPCH